MRLVFLSLGLCALLSTAMAMAKPSFLDPDPVDVDAFYFPDEPTASDQISVFEGNQEEAILLTSNPSLFPESIDEPLGGDSYQNIPTDVISTYDVISNDVSSTYDIIPSDMTSTYEVAGLQNLVSMVPEEAYNPSPDGSLSGDIRANAFPWSEAFPLGEAFPPIEQVLPLDSIFGVQDNVSGVCRDESAQWALCCRGEWNGRGQRNVDKCDFYDPDNPSWMCGVPIWQYCCRRYFPGTREGAVCTRGWS